MKRSENKQTDVAGHEPLLVKPHQAAEMLAMGERTLWTLWASGQIPRVRFGRSVRYHIDDLRKFINDRKEGEA